MSTLSAVSWHSGRVEHTEVFAISYQGYVSSSKDGGAFNVDYSLRASQISAGLDVSGNPEVYALRSSDGAVFANDNGEGWIFLNGYGKSISATSGNAVFVIGLDNAGYEFINNDAGGGWAYLGGYVKAISAGLDLSGNPELFGIGGDNAVWVNDPSKVNRWVSLGGNVTAISAVDNTVFAIDPYHGAWVNNGYGWSPLGGYVTQISAGLDASGNPEVFGIGSNNGAWVDDNGKGWSSLGGYVTQISATMDGTLYATGQDPNEGYVNHGHGWVDLGPIQYKPIP
jgi:hypothetical protein